MRSIEEIERIIKKMGGRIAPRVHYRLAAIISNSDEVLKMSDQMAEAKAYKIQVVSENFLTDILNGHPMRFISLRSLCDWAEDSAINMFDVI